jgi:methoxymalonate biosynthesis acyl carrier protein
MTRDTQKVDHEVIQARLRSLFSEVLHAEVPSIETDLFDTGILDSQKFVELLLHIEQCFNTQINIEDFEIENFRCIDKITALILQRMNANRVAELCKAGTSSTI